MDCHYVSELLLDYIEDELSDEVSRKIEAHLGKCESCSKEFARIEKMVNLMKTLPSITPTPGITKEVMASLAEEERVTIGRFLAKFKHIHIKVMIAAATLGVIACELYVT